ncbi:MAG: hypothetical protein ACRDF7_04985 [Candidatus Limnocylindrales bacterium]
MTMTLERPLPMRELVSHRLRSPGSRERVARSLTQLVEDAFLVDARSPIPHLRDALDEPIAAATETAVDTLIDELADLLDLLPDEDAAAWDRTGQEAQLDYE